MISYMLTYQYGRIEYVTLVDINDTTILEPYLLSQVTAAHLNIGHP